MTNTRLHLTKSVERDGDIRSTASEGSRLYQLTPTSLGRNAVARLSEQEKEEASGRKHMLAVQVGAVVGWTPL